jgi:DNA-binding IclR family transcriptional regulator
MHQRGKFYYRQLMARVHRIAGVCAEARITGVAFFDTEHGQTGFGVALQFRDDAGRAVAGKRIPMERRRRRRPSY